MKHPADHHHRGQGAMRVIKITYDLDGQRLEGYMRDPHFGKTFIRGVLCNEVGVADRLGCSEEVLLMVKADRVVEIVEVVSEDTVQR